MRLPFGPQNPSWPSFPPPFSNPNLSRRKRRDRRGRTLSASKRRNLLFHSPFDQSSSRIPRIWGLNENAKMRRTALGHPLKPPRFPAVDRNGKGDGKRMPMCRDYSKLILTCISSTAHCDCLLLICTTHSFWDQGPQGEKNRQVPRGSVG
jgi:hypothetical protein